MSASLIPSAHTPALPPDIMMLSNVLSLLDISLRERYQLQLVCSAFRDAYDDPQSSAVWGSCSFEETSPTIFLGRPHQVFYMPDYPSWLKIPSAEGTFVYTI